MIEKNNKNEIIIENNNNESYDITNRQILIRKLIKLVPGVNFNDIDKHIDWYIKVTQLTDKKKQLLEEWKQQRLSIKNNQLQLQVNQIDFNNKNINNNITENENIKDNNNNDDERLLIKQKIDTWKLLKQQELDKKKEEEKQKQLLEIKLQLESKRERQEEVRIKLSQWKKNDNNKQLIDNDKNKITTRAVSADPAEIMRRRQRDIELGKERLNKITNKINQSNLRQNKQKEMENQISEQLFSKITRDPTRLLYKTKAAEGQTLSKDYLDDAEYKRNTSSAHSKPIAMSGRDIRNGIRAIPTWCKPR